MSKLHKLAAITGVLVFLFSTSTGSLAQNTARNRGQNQDQSNNNNNNTQGGRRQRGNFDPAQFQERMVERYRDRLEITDDAEWKAIQPRIQKVIEARMALESGRRAAFDRGNRGDRTGRADRNGSDQNQQQRPASTNAPDPATDMLQRAITDKASSSDLKTASAQYLAARKARQATLEKAQEELRMVLTQRQEAIAMLAGLL
jgi:hypothetical protein